MRNTTVGRSPADLRRIPARLRRTHSSRLSVVVLGALLAGCNPESPAESILTADTSPQFVVSLASDQLRAAAGGRQTRGVEDDILRLEAQVAGIGGVFVDTLTNRLTVFVRDVEMREAARSVVGTLARTMRTERGMSWLDDSIVEVLQGDYGFSELVAWHQILLSDLLEIPEFVSIDADEQINRVAIKVESPGAIRLAYEAVVGLGIPIEAVQVTVGERPTSAQLTLRDRVRPTGGGFQIRNLFGQRCTHGFTVTTNQGETGFLTAAHCSSLATGAGFVGENIYQNEVTQNDLVGTVALNEPFDVMGCIDPEFNIPWTGPCTDADVMFVSSNSAVKRVARAACRGWYGPASCMDVNLWYDSIGAVATPMVGTWIDKVGRTTGLTTGVLVQTCISVVVDGAPPYLVLCAGEVCASAGEGDSGSPVFPSTFDDNPPDRVARPMGTLFGAIFNTVNEEGNRVCVGQGACRYWYSPWSGSNLHLGRTFDAGGSPPPPPITPIQVTIDGPTEAPEHAYEACFWSAATTFGSGPISYQWTYDQVPVGTDPDWFGDTGTSGQHWLSVTVTDDTGNDTDLLEITVDPGLLFCEV